VGQSRVAYVLLVLTNLRVVMGRVYRALRVATVTPVRYLPLRAEKSRGVFLVRLVIWDVRHSAHVLQVLRFTSLPLLLSSLPV
jgi:hypothetical protein